MAHEGTIFLDEIGELTNECQTKLCACWSRARFRAWARGACAGGRARAGGDDRDLQAEVKAKRFAKIFFTG